MPGGKRRYGGEGGGYDGQNDWGNGKGKKAAGKGGKGSGKGKSGGKVEYMNGAKTVQELEAEMEARPGRYGRKGGGGEDDEPNDRREVSKQPLESQGDHCQVKKHSGMGCAVIFMKCPEAREAVLNRAARLHAEGRAMRQAEVKEDREDRVEIIVEEISVQVRRHQDKATEQDVPTDIFCAWGRQAEKTSPLSAAKLAEKIDELFREAQANPWQPPQQPQPQVLHLQQQVQQQPGLAPHQMQQHQMQQHQMQQHHMLPQVPPLPGQPSSPSMVTMPPPPPVHAAPAFYGQSFGGAYPGQQFPVSFHLQQQHPQAMQQQPMSPNGAPLAFQQPLSPNGAPLAFQQPPSPNGAPLAFHQPPSPNGAPLAFQQPSSPTMAQPQSPGPQQLNVGMNVGMRADAPTFTPPHGEAMFPQQPLLAQSPSEPASQPQSPQQPQMQLHLESQLPMQQPPSPHDASQPFPMAPYGHLPYDFNGMNNEFGYQGFEAYPSLMTPERKGFRIVDPKTNAEIEATPTRQTDFTTPDSSPYDKTRKPMMIVDPQSGEKVDANQMMNFTPPTQSSRALEIINPVTLVKVELR